MDTNTVNQIAATSVLDEPVDGDYRSPELYELGSLEKFQSYYTGNYYDGPNSWHWYG